MVISSIELKGHGSYRDYTKVDFPLGITAITGEYDGNPLKSNGSGKSTLIMSIIYALFGEGEFKKIKELINVDAPDGDMFVKIHFELNGQNYFLERGIKNDSSYLDFRTSDNSRIGDEDKIKKIQPEIIKALGMDYKMFTTSGFIEQNALDKFINTDPEILRLYINSILGIEIWRNASKLANKKNTKLKDNINNLESDIEKLEIGIKNNKEELSQKIKTENEVESISVELDEHRKFLEQLNESKSKIELLKDIKLEILKIDDSIKRLELDILFEKDTIETSKEDIAHKTKLLSNLVEVSDKKIEDINKLIDLKQKHKLDFDGLINDLVAKITVAKTSLKYETERKNKVQVGKCDECEQDILLDYVNKKHKEIDDKIDNFSQEIFSLSSEKKDAENAVQEVQDYIADLVNEVNELKNSQNKYNVDFKVYSVAITNGEKILSSSQINLEKYQNTLVQVMREKTEAEEKQERIQKEITEDADQKINYIKKTILDLERKLNYYNIELGKLYQLEKMTENLEQTLTKKKKELKDLKKESYIYSVLTVKYKDFAQHKFQHSIDSIQNITNKIIHQILPEISVNFYEDDSKLRRLIVGFEVDGRDRSYKRLSGGQKTVVNIALRLGFSKIIQARVKSNIKFVVLDEPFGALDEDNRDLVSKMLNVMLDWFDQIFIISHVQNMKEFPNIINIGMTQDKISYIK